jgi:oligopeptide/dipeptide ABC transporter ATP-binding protein
MGLLPKPAGRIVGGKIIYNGIDLLKITEKQMRKIRGSQISMILQDPLMALNPVYTIGNQVRESFQLDKVDPSLITQKSVDVLQSVKIPSAKERLNTYPFQFSGGMRQRTCAAMAIAREPRLLIADEPTTSLDVTIQDQFMKLLKEIQQKNKMALILVTHDLGLVAETCDRVAIMYAGRIVETGSVLRVFEKPGHPYTQALMKAVPRLGRKGRRLFQIEGEPPNPAELPPGCYFHPRCFKVKDICRREYPPVVNIGDDGYAACWLLQKGKNK